MKITHKALTILFVTLYTASVLKAVEVYYNGSAKGRLGSLTGGVMAKTITFVDELRDKDPDLLLLCAGDMLGPCLTSEVDGGAQMIKAMNRCGYDACGIGPHDFFAGWDNFRKRAAEAQFHFVCANMKYIDLKSGKRRSPESVRPWLLVQRGGKTIFITGVMSHSFEKSRPSWPQEIITTSPREALEAIRPQAEKADIVIVLSTRKYYSNVRLLERTPWIDILISRTGVDQRPFGVELRDVALPDGRRVLWSHSSKRRFGSVLVDRDDKVFNSSVRVHHMPNETSAEATIAAEIRRLEVVAKRTHQKVITKLSKDEANNFPVTFVQALRYGLKAEIGLFHRAGMLSQKVPETLSYGAIRSFYPFHSRAALVNVTGKRLKELWKVRKKRLVGSKGLLFIGLEEKQNKLLVNGRLLRKKDTYRVATSEYLALGLNDLLPRQQKAVRKIKVIEAVSNHLKSTEFAQRPTLYRRLERRAVHRRNMQFNWAISSLQFDGAADQYQYSDESAEGRRSDIPGFVGRPFRQTAFYLDYESIVDRQRDDFTFRFESTYKTFKGNIRTDITELTTRYEQKDPLRDSNWFSEMSLSTTLEKPSDSTREWPRFGKVVFGRAFRLGKKSKILAGIGYLERFSQANNPSNLGVNLAYEIDRKFGKRFELDAALEYFASLDSDQLHIADAKVAFKLELGGGLSYITRYVRYLWRDDQINNSAHRKELFMGLGVTRKLRRF